MKLSHLYESEDLTFSDWKASRQRVWDINELKKVQRKYPLVDLSKLGPDDTVMVFHGTSTATLPEISRKGLLGMGSDLSVTTDVTYTDQWMEEAAFFGVGGPADEVLLGAVLRRSQLEINKEMAVAEEGHPIHSAFVMGGRIPPERLFVIDKNGAKSVVRSVL